MVSLVIPFYHKFKEFEFSLKHNISYLSRPFIQLILVIDHPCTLAELNPIMIYLNQINHKILINPNTHEWRNPSIVINAGIKASSNNLIIVMSPESVHSNDVIKILMDEYVNKTYIIGNVEFQHFQEFQNNQIDPHKPEIYKKSYPYGSICFNKMDIFDIGGYQEEYNSWGCEDDEIRIKLQSHGIKEVLSTAKIIHLESKHDLYNRSTKAKEAKKNKNSITAPRQKIKSIDELGLGFIILKDI